MAIGTAAIVAGSLIGAGTSIYGARKAAGAARDASDATVAEQSRQFDLVREDTRGLRGLGDAAIGDINRLYGRGQTQPLSFEQWAQQNPQPQVNFDAIPGMAGMTGFAPPPQRSMYDQYVNNFTPAPTTGAPNMSGFFASPDYQFRLDEGQKAVDRFAAAGGRYGSGAALKAGTKYASGLAAGEFASYYDRLAQQAGLGATGIGQSAAAGQAAANNIGSAYMNAGNTRASSYMAGAQGFNNAVQGGLQNYMLSRYLQGGG